MQALYQWDFDKPANSPDQVIRQFCDMQNMEKVDVEYFEALFRYAVENIDEIDTEIRQHLDRELDQLDPIERSVLRICCTELKTQLGTPYKVVVNEALEISKDFGADQGYRYINGISDKLAATLRQIEYQHDHPSGNPLSGKSTKPAPARKQAEVKISVKEKPVESSEKSADQRSSTAPSERTRAEQSLKRTKTQTKKPGTPSANERSAAPATKQAAKNTGKQSKNG